MNFFEELMLARELSFTEGEIRLLGSRVTFLHATFSAEYTLRVNDNPEKVQDLYDVSKVSFRDGMSIAIGKKYHFSFNDFFKWLTQIAMLAGWGKLTWQDLNDQEKSGVILVENAPVATMLKGKVKLPCDHLERGFIAGGATGWLNTNVDCVEEECAALGAAQCRFVFKPREKFTATEEVKRQLGIK